MKTASEFLDNPTLGWKHKARVLEYKFRMTMGSFFSNPSAPTEKKTNKRNFWELFNAGIISLEDQNQEELRFMSGMKNLGSSDLKQILEDYCRTNAISSIPAILKAKAILFLENKFTQVSNGINADETAGFMKSYFSDQYFANVARELNNYQEEFTHSIIKEILEEYRDQPDYSDAGKINTEKQLRDLAATKIRINEDSREMKVLVIQLYFLYLSRYQEFLLNSLQPVGYDGNKYSLFLPEISPLARKSEEQIERWLNGFKNAAEQRKIVNYPEALYDLIVQCRKELDQIRSEVGINHEMYIKSSMNVVYLVTGTLLEMIDHPVTELLLAPIQGLKLGRNLFEECDAVFEEARKIELDNISQRGFNARKTYYESLKAQI
jgi:hypothetical protein